MVSLGQCLPQSHVNLNLVPTSHPSQVMTAIFKMIVKFSQDLNTTLKRCKTICSSHSLIQFGKFSSFSLHHQLVFFRSLPRFQASDVSCSSYQVLTKILIKESLFWLCPLPCRHPVEASSHVQLENWWCSLQLSGFNSSHISVEPDHIIELKPGWFWNISAW